MIVCHKDASCCSLLDYEMPSPALSKNVGKMRASVTWACKVGHCKDGKCSGQASARQGLAVQTSGRRCKAWSDFVIQPVQGGRGGL